MRHHRAVLLACLLGTACAKPPPPAAVTAPPPAAVTASPPAEVAALEARVARLERMLAKREEALAFLDAAYQQRLEQETRPEPGTIYGVDIRQNIALGQVLGSPDALVTVVKAWDFACPHCNRARSVLEELVTEYPGKLRVVLKHMVVHPDQVTTAHLAACAAAKQGKFKAFYKAFWEKGYEAYAAQRDVSLLADDNVFKIASGVGLDVGRLKADLPSCRQVVEADEEELRRFRVNGTPAFFINGEFIGGAIPKDAFKQIIDRKLAIAEQSGVRGADYYEKEIRTKGEKSVTRRTGTGATGR
jgi:protein-disulfide isomerase